MEEQNLQQPQPQNQNPQESQEPQERKLSIVAVDSDPISGIVSVPPLSEEEKNEMFKVVDISKPPVPENPLLAHLAFMKKAASDWKASISKKEREKRKHKKKLSKQSKIRNRK